MRDSAFRGTLKIVALTFSVFFWALSTTLLGLNCAVVANSTQREGTGNYSLGVWNVISMLGLSMICAFGCIAYTMSKATFIVAYHKAFFIHWILDALGTSALIIGITVPLKGGGYSTTTKVLIIVFAVYKIFLLGATFGIWIYVKRVKRSQRYTSEGDDHDAATGNSRKRLSIPLERITSSTPDMTLNSNADPPGSVPHTRSHSLASTTSCLAQNLPPNIPV